MPVLDRQAVREPPARPAARRSRRASRACRRDPSRRSLRRPSSGTTSTCRSSVLICGAIAITALELGARLGEPARQAVRPRRGAAPGPHNRRRGRAHLAVGLGVDAGRSRKGLFRLAWVAVSLVGLAAPGRRRSIARPRRRDLARGRVRARARRPLHRHRVRARRAGLDGPVAQLLPALRHGAAFGAIDGRGPRPAGCPACGHIAYVNPRLVVTTLPITDDGRAHPAPPRHRAGPRLVGPAGRLPRGRRDGRPGGDPRDVRGDRAARRARRDRRALLAARGGGRRRRVRGADRRRRRPARRPRRSRSRRSRPEAIPWPGIAFRTTILGAPRLARPAPAGRLAGAAAGR